MRGSKKDVPVSLELEDVVIQEAEWGDLHVGFESYHKRFDVTPLLKGLPDDLCQSPHWGYVIKGRFQARYKGGKQEVLAAGDAYYLAPGHTVVLDAGTEIVEFSPKEAYQKTMEAATRNFEKLQGR